MARVFDRYLSIHASLPPRMGRRRPSEQLAQRTVQCTAQFIQNIGSIHPGSIVVQPEQGGIADTRFLPQTVKGPSLVFENFSESTNNHGGNLAGPERLCQTTCTCIVSFTHKDCSSKLAAALRGKEAEALKSSGEKRHAS